MVDKELKRTYNIPLRKAYLKAPQYKRAKKAVSAIKIFLTKHMKSENVKLGKNLNDKLWERGIKRPPHHVHVNVEKNSEGMVTAELVGFEYGKEKVSKGALKRQSKQKLEEKIEHKKEDISAQEEQVKAEIKKVKPEAKKE